MKLNAANATVVLALLLAAVISVQGRSYISNQDLLLNEKVWPHAAPQIPWEESQEANEFGNDLPQEYNDNQNYIDDEIRYESAKRSAVATALNGGRRRRHPAPVFGKTHSPMLGIGVLSDTDSYFKDLIGNVKTIVLHPPEERSRIPEPPNVANAQTSRGGSGGIKHNIYTFRPIKPDTNIRYYKRRSYPLAYPFDPRPLFIGLGR